MTKRRKVDHQRRDQLSEHLGEELELSEPGSTMSGIKTVHSAGWQYVPVFVVADFPDQGSVVLDGAEGRHAAQARRMLVGERIRLSNGQGRFANGCVTKVSRESVVMDVIATEDVPKPEVRVAVIQALAKGDRAERAVEMMTEADVDRIVPWSAERCVVRWASGDTGSAGARGDIPRASPVGKAERGAERWRLIAREAAKQARRAWHPEISPLMSTSQVVAAIEPARLTLVLHESATIPVAEVPLPDSGWINVVVGPEGGISEVELARFTEAGAINVRLGTTILRTSTAGVAALSILNARTARWR